MTGEQFETVHLTVRFGGSQQGRAEALTLPVRGDLSLRRLDETTMIPAGADPIGYRESTETLPHDYGTFELELSPYATITVEGRASE